MAVRTRAATLQAMLDAYETDVGATALLRFYTGAVQGTFGTVPAGTLIASISLGDFMQAATAVGLTGATKIKTASTLSVAAAAAGTVGSYALTLANATTVIEDGTVTATGGGGDITVDNTSVTAGQTVTLTSFTKNL